MIEKETASHFDDVSTVWENKIWVNREDFDQKVFDFAELTGEEVALDVGSGTGALASKFPVKQMFALDISTGMMELSPLPRHQCVVGSGQKIPFLDNTFDVVTARNLMKHLDDPDMVLQEMKRVLKPRGKLLLIESAPYKRSECDIPTQLVRIVEPYHPRFRSHDEWVEMTARHFPVVDSQIEVIREKWLGKWCEAKKATPEQRAKILELYKNASEDFIKGQRVEIFEGEQEILNDFPWSIIKAVK